MIADRWVTADYDVARTHHSGAHGVADISVDIGGANHRQLGGLSHQLTGIHIARTGHLGVQKIHLAKRRDVTRSLGTGIELSLLKVIQSHIATALDADA